MSYLVFPVLNFTRVEPHSLLVHYECYHLSPFWTVKELRTLNHVNLPKNLKNSMESHFMFCITLDHYCLYLLGNTYLRSSLF